MAKLYFRYGAMNSGKSTALMQVAHNYEEQGMKVLILKPQVDTKGGGELVSRLGVRRKADLLIPPELDVFAAVKAAKYLETELIGKSDYFSTTLDANCEDKEAAIYSAIAMYYLTLVSSSAEREHYIALMRKAAYFALSWFYTWDVPFAPSQMLGDEGFKTRGWGNVSVENNHVDVYVFDFVAVLRFLGNHAGEKRLAQFADVISTSMLQLMPMNRRMCGVGKEGFYPEVVQHTTWDYGDNGKGFYNDVFAPGWTVASLWTILSPERLEQFFGR